MVFLVACDCSSLLVDVVTSLTFNASFDTFSSCWQMPFSADSAALRKRKRLRTELFTKEERS